MRLPLRIFICILWVKIITAPYLIFQDRLTIVSAQRRSFDYFVNVLSLLRHTGVGMTLKRIPLKETNRNEK